MNSQSFDINRAQTNEERRAAYEAKLTALPIEERAKFLARDWQVTPQFALRFIQLEAEVATLKAK